MRRIEAIALLTAGAAVMLAGRAAMAAPVRFPLTRAAVAAAVAAAEPRLSSGELQMPGITASLPSPALVVQSMQTMGGRAVRLRIACREAGVCLPFLVTVQQAVQQPAEVGSALPVAPPARGTQTAGQTLTAATVRPGARLTLHIDSGPLHITMPVVCLAGGNVGQTVRVASLDRKRMFAAEIIGPSDLKGSLEQ